MKLSEIEFLENQIEYDFKNFENVLKNLNRLTRDNDLNINTNRIKENIRVAFGDLKNQIESLKLEAIKEKE